MKFLRVTILQGGRISHFPIDIRMGLTAVQRDCAACDSYLASLTGTRLVEAAWCQSAETGRRLNDDVILRRLFTLHYCTIVAVSATSDTAGKFAIGQGVPSACGLTLDNRAVSLDTVTKRHYSAHRQ